MSETPAAPEDPGGLLSLIDAVERADLDPRVHVIVLSGRGKGFCGGYDLTASAERLLPSPSSQPLTANTARLAGAPRKRAAT